MKIRLIVGTARDAEQAVADAEQQVNAFVAQPHVLVESLRTTIAEHAFDPTDTRAFVCVITVIYDELASITPSPRLAALRSA